MKCVKGNSISNIQHSISNRSRKELGVNDDWDTRKLQSHLGYWIFLVGYWILKRMDKDQPAAAGHHNLCGTTGSCLPGRRQVGRQVNSYNTHSVLLYKHLTPREYTGGLGTIRLPPDHGLRLRSRGKDSQPAPAVRGRPARITAYLLFPFDHLDWLGASRLRTYDGAGSVCRGHQTPAVPSSPARGPARRRIGRPPYRRNWRRGWN